MIGASVVLSIYTPSGQQALETWKGAQQVITPATPIPSRASLHFIVYNSEVPDSQHIDVLQREKKNLKPDRERGDIRRGSEGI